MNQTELDNLTSYQRALSQADGLLAAFPETEPSPVTEADMDTVLNNNRNMRGNIEDATLSAAINTANATWKAAIKTALETSKTTAETNIGNLVGTDTVE